MVALGTSIGLAGGRYQPSADFLMLVSIPGLQGVSKRVRGPLVVLPIHLFAAWRSFSANTDAPKDVFYH